MDRKRFARMLCALLSATLLFADLPASELRAAADGAAWSAQEASPEAAHPEAPTAVDIEADALPEPEAQTEAEDAAEEPEATEVGNEIENTGDELITEEAEDIPAEEDEGEISLEALTSGWVSDMDAQGVRGEYARALWLYDRVIVNFTHGGEDEALPAIMGLNGSPLGYARALSALLDAAGIENQTVEGDSAAWNLAKLDGEWAHIDAYADDAADCYGTHFGLSDAAMARDHQWSAELPACSGAQNSYFVRARGYRAFSDTEELRALLADALASGEGELYLYNSGAELSAVEALPACLAELDPAAKVSVSEKGCYAAAIVQLPVVDATIAPDAPVARVAAMDIVPSVDSLILGKGETAFIGYTLVPKGAQAQVTFSAKPANIVAGDQEGNIVARNTGKATIYLTTENGGSAEIDVIVRKAPTGVSITGDRTVLGVGEIEQLGSKITSGAAGRVTFSIPEEQQQYASVTEDGLITALAPGEVSVTAETYNGKKSKAVVIEIRPAPTRVTPPMEELRIGEGDSWTPEWAIDEGAAGKLSFTSSDPGVAEVDPDSGTILAKSIGSAVVTASAYGVASGEMPVSVVPALTGLELGEAPTLGVKQTLQIEPLLKSSDGTFDGDLCTLNLSYKSSKTKVASVSADGVITAKKAGKAKITVKAAGNMQDSYTVVVKKAPTSVSILADRRTLGAGEQLRLGYQLSSGSVGSASFSIPDEAQRQFASVSEDGLITAIAPGRVSVTATTHNGKTKSVSIEVLPAPTSIEITEAPECLGAGDSAQVVAKLNEGSAGELYYRIAEAGAEEAAVAEIDAGGRVKALKPGTAVIEVYTYAEGVTASANLTVVPAPEYMRLPEESIDLGVDDTYQIAPELSPEGSAARLSYSTSKNKCASVNDTGLVTANATGSAKIAVETHNGIEKVLTVNVLKKPGSVSLSKNALQLSVGESEQLSASLPGGTASTLTFESSDENIATVAQDGTVTALAPGEAEIRVTTHNGKSDSCIVTVSGAPTAIRFEENYRVSLDQEDFAPRYTVEPEGAHVKLSYELVSGGAVKLVDNQICAVKKGEAVIRATTQVEGVEGQFTVIVTEAPSAVSLPENFAVALDGGPVPLVPTLEPEDAATEFSFEISGKKKDFFSIDPSSGEITPHKVGRSEVTVTTHNGKSATTTVWVVEDLRQTQALEYLGDSPVKLNCGGKYTPSLYIFPAGTDPQLTWRSTDDSIASVDESGTVQGNSAGSVTITGTPQGNPKLEEIKYKLVVLSEDRCLIMPEHRTGDKTIIETNEQEILNVRQSAYDELDELVNLGYINSSERTKRKAYVKRAFDMFNFAWTPNDKKGYWKAANSEGGQKDFKPDTIYFGMPYTQNNRMHWLQSLKDGGYVSEQDNYYVTTDKFKSRSYPGSDCSSFCSMAVWGYEHKRAADSTAFIAKASYYKKLGSKYWTDLRPGDLICSSGHHVVMFLYYTNEARTQFVVIEQGGGGSDLYSNCVSTSIRDASYYTSRSYKIYRPEGLDTTYVENR